MVEEVAYQMCTQVYGGGGGGGERGGGGGVGGGRHNERARALSARGRPKCPPCQVDGIYVLKHHMVEEAVQSVHAFSTIPIHQTTIQYPHHHTRLTPFVRVTRNPQCA